MSSRTSAEFQTLEHFIFIVYLPGCKSMLASSLLGVLIVSLCDMILAYVEAEISTLLLPVADREETELGSCLASSTITRAWVGSGLALSPPFLALLHRSARLGESPEKRGITHLFPIQVLLLLGDQMLAVGFEEAVKSILENLPQKRQSMFFSETMPSWVKKLARKYLDNPLNIYLVGDQDEKLAEGIKLYAISATSNK
ncbi:hypothetical protein F2Q70_00035034 [Brassica cretica]|uniref:Uncharacterized protein n=2 Tax=Brassica cretica TaxID=69181 RepID=A0A8S9JXZ4_BRACR|nr:hypothetical protein F2Q70_00035034 [Brassica cretica]